MAKAKKSKKAVQNDDHRLRTLLSAAVVLIPALLAAATAFMNTAFARDNGWNLDDATSGTKSKGRRSKKSAA